MSEETKEEEKKTFTQEDMDKVIEGRLARERAKSDEQIGELKKRLDDSDSKKADAEAKAEEEAKAKMSTSEHVKALEARLENMQTDMTAKDKAAALNSLNSASKDVLLSEGLNAKFAKFAMGELEEMRTVTTEGVFYKNVSGVAISQDEALALIKSEYPSWFSDSRKPGATLPTGQGGSEADHSSESMEQFRSRREKEGHYKN